MPGASNVARHGRVWPILTTWGVVCALGMFCVRADELRAPSPLAPLPEPMHLTPGPNNFAEPGKRQPLARLPAPPDRKPWVPFSGIRRAAYEVAESSDPNTPFPVPAELQGIELMKQTAAEAAAKSWSCLQCHTGVGDMHQSRTLHLGCIDCHGGCATTTEKSAAHVAPRFPEAWGKGGNPVRSYTLLNHERPEFVRFVNPGDLRVAHLSCGTAGCHGREVLEVRKSMMTHGCMLWGAALYNNGAVPHKRPKYGESYSMYGQPLRLQTVPAPTQTEIERDGVLPYLDPLPRFEITQPGNILRIFERGGRFKPETGLPETREEPGRPRTRLSNRGLGTLNRTDPVFIGLTKTRLLDPTLNFLGTNDHAGDFRSSGCSACHVAYANDRNPTHSGPLARYGNRGLTAADNPDPTISKSEPGHPIAHKFSPSIPTSQCIVCHIHPGTTVMNSYLGFMWWDNETDGEHMYPHEERTPSAEEVVQANMSNPEEAAARGLWSNPEFLANLTDLNPRLRHTQFADFHGHGWVFRAVYRKNRQGEMVDYKGHALGEVSNAQLREAMMPTTPAERETGRARENTPVHYLDVHLEKGMHCVDCHFRQDSHGNAKLYGEVRAAIEIQCIDCHGSYRERAHASGSLVTSGPAAPRTEAGVKVGTNLGSLRTPWGQPRFEVLADGSLLQRSVVDPDLKWTIVQTADTLDPGHASYNEKSALAKTARFNEQGQITWGDLPRQGERPCAHSENNLSCIACHSSWNTTCYGCHLPQKANVKTPSLHAEGDVSRNLVSYNFQTLRDEVYMLARDGDVTGNRIGPVRSACAVHVGSYNQNRESIYVQQQTISAEGLSGISFSTNVPHTVRGGPPRVSGLPRNSDVHRNLASETKMCTDCHVSEANDNNALLAQLFMQGTNYMNLIGRYCWVAGGEHGIHAVTVTEREEPQAVIGSSLHALAFPERYKAHLAAQEQLEHAYEHPGIDVLTQYLRPFQKKPEILQVQHRGEYLYAACGEGGLRVFDIAFVDHKGFSERIVSAPVSPLGQQFFVKTKFAAAVAAPTTLAPDPTRTHRPENKEPGIHPLYAYLYVADKCEGLILVGAGTLLDGDPTNNFLRREVTFNPDGILNGARAITIAGTYAYLCCDVGIVVVALDNPKEPRVTCVIGSDVVHNPTCVQVQFRYAFACDHDGLKVFDVTDLARPQFRAVLPLKEAHNVYVARSYAYVAGGKEGLLIVNVENPERPVLDQAYTAKGCLNEVHDVKLGITYASLFAYVADGANGLRVVQLTSPDTPGASGFATRPMPRLVATLKLPKGGHALSISEGIDRDRAIDESGNQIAVFGRIGARPLNLEEQRRMYLTPQGNLWRVTDNPRDERYRPTRPAFLK